MMFGTNANLVCLFMKQVIKNQEMQGIPFYTFNFPSFLANGAALDNL
jgi:hypothetical protein